MWRTVKCTLKMGGLWITACGANKVVQLELALLAGGQVTFDLVPDKYGRKLVLCLCVFGAFSF
jgi:hypothetical protein